MLESEAKTKWCPMARVASHYGPNTVSVNRANETLMVNCIGSNCMMWRQTDNEGAPCLPDEEPTFGPAGFCGLSRK